MDKATFNSLVKKKESKDSVVISVRIRQRTADKLKAKGIDIAETVRNILDRLSD